MRFLPRRFLALFAGVALVCAAANTARADVLTYNAFPYTGSSAQATVTFKDGADAAVAGNVDVTITVVPSPNIGDLRGFFVNFAGSNTLFSNLTATGPNVTQVVKSADNVSNLGGGVNTNPEGPFDIGVEIGTPGIGGDDIQSTTITFSSSAPLTNAMFTTDTDPVTASGPNALLFALRMTSVGLPGGPREGSSKLGGNEGTNPGNPGGGPGIVPAAEVVPEPASMAVWAVAGAASFWLARRRRPRPTA